MDIRWKKHNRKAEQEEEGAAYRVGDLACSTILVILMSKYRVRHLQKGR